MTASSKRKRLLKESIEHWCRLLACTTPEEVHIEGFDADDCPLCLEYLGENCHKCPVFGWTGVAGCINTPYREVSYRLSDYETLHLEEFPFDGVAKEIWFLKMLLQKEEL